MAHNLRGTATFNCEVSRVITPGSPEHMRLVSPSKVASICGVSRWHSPYRLWHVMKGLIEPEPGKDIFVVGHAFEMAMAELWREENPGWRLSAGEVQYVTDRFGFPACATIDRRASRGRSRKIVEMKIARSLEEWGDPDLSGDAPADYVLQVMAQQAFSGLDITADLMVMGPFFKHRTYRIDYDEQIINWMLSECSRFYASLSLPQPPPLDDSVSTYQTVRQLHPDIEAGVTVEVPAALAADLLDAKAQVGKMERELRGLKTKLLDKMGNSQHATCNGSVVATRRPHRNGVALLITGSEA